MDSMSGCDIRLVFTFPPKENTLQYKKCVHLWNNFPCFSTLSKPMRKVTCSIQMRSQGGTIGAIGAKPSPGQVKSMDFRGFSGPNGCWAPFLEWMWSLSSLGHGKDGEDIYENSYSSLLRKVRSYSLDYICLCLQGLPGNSEMIVVIFLSFNYEILLWIL